MLSLTQMITNWLMNILKGISSKDYISVNAEKKKTFLTEFEIKLHWFTCFKEPSL